MWLWARAWRRRRIEAVGLCEAKEATTDQSVCHVFVARRQRRSPPAAGMDDRRSGVSLGRCTPKLVGCFARLVVINRREPFLRPKADERHPDIHPNPSQTDARRRPRRPRGGRAAPPANLDGPRIRPPRTPARPQARAALDLFAGRGGGGCATAVRLSPDDGNPGVTAGGTCLG